MNINSFVSVLACLLVIYWLGFGFGPRVPKRSNLVKEDKTEKK